MSPLLLHGMQPLICLVDKNPKASPCREDIAALLGLNSASAVMSSPEPRAASLAFLPRPAPTLSLSFPLESTGFLQTPSGNLFILAASWSLTEPPSRWFQSGGFFKRQSDEAVLLSLTKLGWAFCLLQWKKASQTFVYCCLGQDGNSSGPPSLDTLVRSAAPLAAVTV